jgi:hypothetical protein
MFATKRATDAAEVEPLVLVEALVLDREDRLPKLVRDVTSRTGMRNSSRSESTDPRGIAVWDSVPPRSTGRVYISVTSRDSGEPSRARKEAS